MPDLDVLEGERIADYSRLTRDDQRLIRQLRDAGKTQIEIAQAINCHQSTVSKWLSTWYDSRDEARDILRQGAAELAHRIVKKANPMTALETLDRLEVTEKKAPAGQGKGGVTVLIGAQDSQVQVNIFPDLSPVPQP